MTKTAATLDLSRRLRAVLFIDVVDSVRLIHVDETGTIGRWRALAAEIAEQDLPGFGGRLVKLMGDGLLVEFESTVNAVAAALAIQKRIAHAEGGMAEPQRIRVRMGMHVTDVLADGLDIYGDGVNLAARLRDLAAADEIVVSASVRDQLTDGLGVDIEDLGDRKLKGLDRAVRTFRVWAAGWAPMRSPDRSRRSGDRPAIAVLPFRNHSGNPRNDFLGEVIAEDVIADLSKLTDLHVISRLSTSPFRERLLEPRSIAELLGVRYVLAGSLRASDARIRLSAELTEAEAGHVIWADRFEGPLAEIFELQDRLSIEIAKRAVPHLRQIEFRRARAKSFEDLTAYELTLRAIDLLHGRSRDDLARAQAALAQAIAVDPSYGTPRVWLARSHVLSVGQGWSDDVARDTGEALRHAEDAVACDPEDAYALAVWGFVRAYLRKDHDAAIGHYNRALTLNPSAVWPWAWSASAHAWRGEGAKAVELVERAIDLSPFDPHMYNFAAIACGAHAVAGDYDKAVEWGRRSLRENRLFSAAHKLLTISLSLAGREGEARLAATELLQLEPKLTVAEFRNRHPGSGGPHIDRFCDALAAAGVPR